MDVEPTAILLLQHMDFKVQEHLRSFIGNPSLDTVSRRKVLDSPSLKSGAMWLQICNIFNIQSLGFQELREPLN